jgi:hypothetical protein
VGRGVGGGEEFVESKRDGVAMKGIRRRGGRQVCARPQKDVFKQQTSSFSQQSPESNGKEVKKGTPLTTLEQEKDVY